MEKLTEENDFVSEIQNNDYSDVHLFVVNIETIQQQGIELTPEIAAVMPELRRQVLDLAEQFLGVAEEVL